VYRIEAVTTDKYQYAQSNDRHLLQSTMTPDDACALFGQGYADTYWDATNSKPRVFPDGECGPQGMGMLYGQGGATAKELLKKVCSLTGPTTNISCGENGYFGYLNKFATPLMGLISDKCR
jgi:hypothetical protein